MTLFGRAKLSCNQLVVTSLVKSISGSRFPRLLLASGLRTLSKYRHLKGSNKGCLVIKDIIVQ